MGIIIDIVVIGIILLCLFRGYRKGLIGLAFSIVSFIVSLIVAFVLVTPISSYVINNMEFDDNIKVAIVENFTSEKTDDTTDSNFINEYIDKQIQEAKGKTVEVVATEISEICIKVVVFVALFIVVRIILMFFKAIANLIAELPILKQFNKLGGIAFGLLKGLVITYGALAILLLVSPMFNESSFYKELDKSLVAGTMYNNNIIVNILF